MPGGGSIQGMRNSLSNNKKLLRSKRYFKKERSFLNVKAAYLKAAEGKIDLEKASKEDLLNIKNEIRSKMRKEQKRQNLIIISSLILIVAFLSFFVFKLIKQDQIVVANQEKVLQQKNEKEYLRRIERGDQWLKESKWYNSRFNYKKAKDIYPNDFAIHYRILNSYVLECENDFNNCNEAKKLLDKMLLKFPEKEVELKRLQEKLTYEY